MNYKEKYNAALERAKTITEKLEDTHIKGFIYHIFPELKESEDERIRKWLIDWVNAVNYWSEQFTLTREQIIAWLEKQKDASSIERVFRPDAGCTITNAATQAVEQQQLGYKIVLAFNGAYIPVEGKTVKDIINEYYSWIEKGHFEKKNKD